MLLMIHWWMTWHFLIVVSSWWSDCCFYVGLLCVNSMVCGSWDSMYGPHLKERTVMALRCWAFLSAALQISLRTMGKAWVSASGHICHSPTQYRHCWLWLIYHTSQFMFSFSILFVKINHLENGMAVCDITFLLPSLS